jgi:hypothetical protein
MNARGFRMASKSRCVELAWPDLNIRNGVRPPDAYVHGELFGVGGVKTTPDNPRGERSMSIENRAKGKGEWNPYDVVAVDGTIKLAVRQRHHAIDAEERVLLSRVRRRRDALPQHAYYGASGASAGRDDG